MRIVIANNNGKILHNVTEYRFIVNFYDDKNVKQPTTKWSCRGGGERSTNVNGYSYTYDSYNYFITVTLKNPNRNRNVDIVNTLKNLMFSYSASQGQYQYVYADFTVTQLAYGKPPFSIMTKDITIDSRLQTVKIPYIKYITQYINVSQVNKDWEYNLEYDPFEDSIDISNNEIYIYCDVNKSNKVYHQDFRFYYDTYEEIVRVNQSANPDALYFTLWEAETVVKPYVATPSTAKYKITVISNSDEGVTAVMGIWGDEEAQLLTTTSLTRVSKETIGDNTRYVYEVSQKTNNTTQNKRSEDYYFILRDSHSNELLIERITYTQEPYNRVYVTQDVVLDYTYYDFYDIEINGDVDSLTDNITIVEKPTWVTDVILNLENKKITLVGVGENTAHTERSGRFEITLSTNKTLQFNIRQNEKPIIYAESAWKKHYVTISEEQPYFMLHINDVEVYNGRHIGESIEISDIVKDYVDLPTLNFNDMHTEYQPTLVSTFASRDNNMFARQDMYNVIWNYSYDDNLTAQDFFLTNIYQCTSAIDPRQFLPCTVRNFNEASLEPKIYEFDADGLVINTTSIEVEPNTEKVYNVLLRPNINTKRVEFSEQSIVTPIFYDVRCTNANYCLYYLNPSGGWAWMLFEGKNTEKSSIVRSMYENKNGEKEIYLENITDTVTLTTGLMQDKYSANFKYLVESPRAYLHDLENDVVYSVNINTNSTETKTFRGNGRKYSTYSIDVQKKTIRYINS